MKLLFCVATFAVSSLMGQDKPVAPDNTKVNERDRAKGAVTAGSQKMNAGDRELTRKIRKSVYDDKSLSTSAHNVKIISQHGAVTLRGPVKTMAEKESVASKAMAIAGKDKVTNEIEVIVPKS